MIRRIRARPGEFRHAAVSLLPYVNARRLRAAAQLVLRGDLVTVRQRLRATSAVAGAAHGSDATSGRPVQRRQADPWPRDLPLVSVIIPCFNYGRYIDEAIGSVLAQTLGDRVEVIVVDGGSTEPATQKRLRGLAVAPPPRVRVLLREDGRHLVGDNRNFGIRHARGRYVCCLDADDVLEPIYLEVAVFLAEHFGYDVVSTATRCFGAVQDTFGLLPEPDLRDMLRANNVTTVAVFSRQLWERSGGYRDAGLGGDHVHEDWRLWVRLAALGARIRNITSSELFRYRVHSGESLSRQSGLRNLDWQRQQIRAENADVVSPAALAASARGRRVEVVVEGGLDNLLPVVQDGRPGLLICVPFLLLGGAERLLSGLTATLIRQQWRVVVVTTHPSLPKFGDSTGWFTTSTPEVFHLPRLFEAHQWTPFLHHLIRAKGIDVVLQAGSAFTYSVLATLRRQHPNLRVADLLFNTDGHTAANRRHANEIDLNLCESLEVERWLQQAGETPERIVRIPSGVDLQALVPAEREPLPEQLVVGYNGRLSEEKDPFAFIELAKQARHPRLRFVMTGVGQLEKQVRRRVARSEGAVEYLGAPPDVLAHVAQLDLLVVPSKLDGRPMAVLEALALGVPVLATRVGALPELVHDGVNGFTCPPGQVASFRLVLHRLAEEKRELDTLKRQARSFAEAHLDQRVSHADYQTVLRRLARLHEGEV